MLKTSPSLWLWEHTLVGCGETHPLPKETSVWSIDSGSRPHWLLAFELDWWTASWCWRDCPLFFPFVNQLILKAMQSALSCTLSAWSPFTGQRGQCCLFAHSDLMTPSDPSSSTPGPSTWCHVLLETLLTNQSEQEPLLLLPVGACHVTSGPTRARTQLSIEVFEQQTEL